MRLTPLAKLERSREAVMSELNKMLDNLDKVLERHGFTQPTKPTQSTKLSKKKRKKRTPSLNC